MLPDYYKSELYHYGVLGMKWGIRKGRTEQAYTKASKKINKLDRKVNKAEAKALKTRTKADAKMGSLFYSENRKKNALAIGRISNILVSINRPKEIRRSGIRKLQKLRLRLTKRVPRKNGISN